MTERLLFLLYNTYYAHVAYNVTARVRDFYRVMISLAAHGSETDPSGAFATSAGKDTVVEFTEKNSTL